MLFYVSCIKCFTLSEICKMSFFDKSRLDTLWFWGPEIYFPFFFIVFPSHFPLSIEFTITPAAPFLSLYLASST